MFCGSCFAVPVLWNQASGGNGHFYELVEVTTPLSWTEARDAAFARGGYLASISNLAENQFVAALGNASLRYIGAFQPQGSQEPAGGWSWVSSESFGYTRWYFSEPNNSPPGENFVVMWSSSGWWIDIRNIDSGWPTRSFIVEYDAPPAPRLFALCVGQKDVGHLRGDLGANAVLQALSRIPAWASPESGNSNSIIMFEQFNDSVKPSVELRLAAIANAIRPGDTFIFYYNGHGGPTGVQTDGNEVAKNIQTDSGVLIGDTGDEYLSGDLSDDALLQMFSGSQNSQLWSLVRKFFVLDCCHAGGFFGASQADIGDLEKLPNTWLFASATEEGQAVGFKDGMGLWTQTCLLPSLDKVGWNPTQLWASINDRVPLQWAIYFGQTMYLLDGVGSPVVFSGQETFWSAAPGSDGLSAVLPAVSLPEIALTKAANSLTMSWSASATGYVLETSDDLASWSIHGTTPSLNGLSQTVIETPLPLGGSKFYRLRRP